MRYYIYMKKLITLLIPAYNEEEVLSALFERLDELAKSVRNRRLLTFLQLSKLFTRQRNYIGGAIGEIERHYVDHWSRLVTIH